MKARIYALKNEKDHSLWSEDGDKDEAQPTVFREESEAESRHGSLPFRVASRLKVVCLEEVEERR